MKDEVFIHIGLHKTASSFLQQSVFRDININFVPIPRREYFVNDEFDSKKALNEIKDRCIQSKNSNKMLISQEYFSGDIENNNIININKVADRLKFLFPNAKILLVLRHQIGYLESLYNYRVVNRGYVYTKFDQFFEERIAHNIVEKLCYSSLITTYHNVFGQHNVKILLYEQLIENQDDFLSKIYKWLGEVPKIKKDYQKINNVRKNPKLIEAHRLVNYPFNKVVDCLHSNRIISKEQLRVWRNFYSNNKHKSITNFASKFISNKNTQKYAVSEKYVKYFRADNNWIMTNLGLDLESYGYPL